MKTMLYLMRHATADVRTALVDDADRCLNEKGRLQARRVAAFMQKHGLIPDRIAASPQAKAIQTAALLRKDLALAAAVEEWPELLPEVSVAVLQAAIAKQAQQDEALLLVGHEAELATLICQLTGAEHSFLELKKASLTCLILEVGAAQPVQLAWSIPAKFM